MKRHTNLAIQAPAAAIAALALLLAPAAARAATCTVTSTADSGDGTLREAIGNTNCDSIQFGVTGDIYLEQWIQIERSVTIAGPGANLLEISQNHWTDPVFWIEPEATVGLSGLTIGKSSSNSGSVGNEGTLTVADCVFTGKDGGTNGALANWGKLTVRNSVFSGNFAASGGGIHNHSGPVSVENSTFSNNDASEGGAIMNSFGQGEGTLTITNSTFSGNSANIGGAIRQNGGIPIIVTNSTLSGNWAEQPGDSIFASTGSVTVKNTILAGSASGVNCDVTAGSIIDGEGNLRTDNTCPGTYIADPMLEPLADNGGATPTMALLPGSPAIDAAVAANCPATDQRGTSRPQGYGCDIGAFELVQQSGPVFSGFFAPLSNDLTNVVKAGQAVPVNFSLGGDWGLNIVGSPTSKQVACPNSSVTIVADDSATAAAGNSGLSYNAVTQTYTYVWKTDKAWANTCRQFDIGFSVNGNLTKSVTFFFRK